MTLRGVSINRDEVMIFTTLSLLSGALVILQQVPVANELQDLKDGISSFVIIGLLGVVGVIIWKWVDAVNENTKAQRALTQSMLDMTTRHDEKIKSHDDKFEQLTSDVHDIRGEVKTIKSEFISEIKQTVKNEIEQINKKP